MPIPFFAHKVSLRHFYVRLGFFRRNPKTGVAKEPKTHNKSTLFDFLNKFFIFFLNNFVTNFFWHIVIRLSNHKHTKIFNKYLTFLYYNDDNKTDFQTIYNKYYNTCRYKTHIIYNPYITHIYNAFKMLSNYECKIKLFKIKQN